MTTKLMHASIIEKSPLGDILATYTMPYCNDIEKTLSEGPNPEDAIRIFQSANTQNLLAGVAPTADEARKLYKDAAVLYAIVVELEHPALSSAAYLARKQCLRDADLCARLYEE